MRTRNRYTGQDIATKIAAYSCGVDFGNCLEKGEKYTEDKTRICAPGVAPGPVWAVSVRLAQTQDEDSRDQHYSYEQGQKI